MRPSAPEQETQTEQKPQDIPARSPLIYLLIALITGYALSTHFPQALSPLTLRIGGFGLLTASALVLLSGERRALWAAIFLLGAVLLSWDYALNRMPVRPADWDAMPPRETTLELEVWRTFDTKASYSGMGGLAKVTAAPPHLKSLIGQRVQYYLDLDTPTTHMRTLQVSAKGKLTYLPVPEEQEGFRRYLESQHVYFTFTDGQVMEVIDTGNPFTRLCAQLNDRFSQHLLLGTQERESHGVLAALVLGKKSLIPDTLETRYIESGTMHFFAISGLHVGILAAFVYWVLARLRCRGLIAALIGLAVVYTYVQITGAKPSATRAFIMVAFLWGARACTRQPLSLPALVASAITVLILEPTQLGSPGFQLSYSVVGAILLYGAPASNKWLHSYEPERYLPVNVRLSRWNVLGVAGRWIGSALMITLSATLASAPLIASYFHVWTPGGIILNLLLFPLVGVLLIGGLMSALLGWLSPALSAAINALLGHFIDLLNGLLATSLDLPGLFVQDVTLSLPLAYVLTLLVLVSMVIAQLPASERYRRTLFALPLVTGFAIQFIFIA